MIIGAHTIISSRKPDADRAFLRDRLKLRPMGTTRHWLSLLTALFLATTPVAFGQHTPADSTTPPGFLMGQFVDDYGNRFSITATEWRQHPSARYHVREWHPAEQYVIAQNDSANPGQGGRWTRIDWLPLGGMAPYTWAFCFSAYDAATPETAAAVTVARRDTPRTGCNGNPFSRMRPAADGEN